MPNGSRAHMNLNEMRLLLVDDEEIFRKGLARALTRKGIVSRQAGNGEECLSVLEKEKIDVVVLDSKMPGMNGLEVLDHIKEKYPKTEVLILTGFATTKDGVNGMKLGAFDYLSKPVQLELLLGKIMQAYQKILGEEEIRREAESRYQALLQSVTDYVVAVNRNYQIIMANNLFKKKFGSPSDGFCFNRWKNRDKKCEHCPVEKSFQDGQVHISEEEVVMEDGTVAQMHIRSTPVRNEKGKIIYVLETATDISKKKFLQDGLTGVARNLEGMVAERLSDLQESEKRYRTIFERSRDAILLIDSNAKILEINQSGTEILGKTKKAVLNLKSVAELFLDRESLPVIQKTLSQRGYVTEFDTKLIGKEGVPFDALITSNVILDEVGQIDGYVVIIRDVTQRRRAQRQLERRNIRFAILKAVSMAVSSSLDLNELLYSSMDKMLETPEILEPDSVRIYLLDEDKKALELVAHKGHSEKFVSKDYILCRRVGEGSLGKVIVTGKTMVVDNIKESKDLYVDTLLEEGLNSTVYIPLVSKGQPVGVMCVSSHSDYEFSSYHVEFLTAIGSQLGVAVDNANLYEESRRRYIELKKAQEQVIRSEKLASLGKLSATIAHEINNPLAAVLTYVKLLMKLIERDLFSQERKGDVQRYLETMGLETARCGEIVKNLLAFSRHSKIKIGSHRIEEIIKRTVLLISHDLEMKNVQMLEKIEPDLPDIKCDFKQIQQAFLNLMSNASESMDNGGTLTVSATRSEDEGFVEVVISDTGSGISKEDLKNIFEPFFTTKEEGKGVGLGLSVVFGIITRHNGSIEVESEIEKGTRFRVLLPVA